MSLPGVLAGYPKIGETTIITMTANFWTALVLQDLTLNPWFYPTKRYCIKTTGAVFVAQANSSLSQQGLQVSLPADPSVVTSGTSSGLFELLPDVYWYVDATRRGENSLWFYSTGTPTIRIADISETPYDNS